MKAKKIVPIFTWCPVCKKGSTVAVRFGDYEKYKSGKALAQDAFPYLSAEDREQLISGICPKCWNKIFS